ncbi:MAG: phosphatase PAP2 family protein [Actinobacteria bacterium]|nr:phosphatase PAP2 family protein [Actinomycetota bacterium]
MRRDVRDPILASVACALLLAPLVAAAYGVGAGRRLDASVLNRFAAHDGSVGHTLAAAVVALGEPVALLGMLALLVTVGLLAGRTRETIAAVVLVLGANVTTQLLKQLLAHPRLQEAVVGSGHPWPDSFPSGHTTAAASIAVAALLVVPPRLRAATALAGAAFTVAMGIAVLVLQWHFPSDVLGALLVVGSWAFAVIAALRLVRPRGPDSPPRGKSETASGQFAVSLR